MKKMLSAAVFTGSMLLAGFATAATVVTLNPQAQNGLGANGVISASNAAFQAVGMQTNLYTTLTVFGNTGTTNFTETGLIDVTSFRTAANTDAPSGVFDNYKIQGALTVTGTGTWGGTTFSANASGLTLSVVLTAISATNQTIQLGTATLAPGAAVAFALAAGSLTPGSSGQALTSLSASLNFTPAAGTTGATGFFQAPTPFNLGLAVGNAGGNTLNTGYTVAANGTVTFSTPLAGTNPGTANITFVNQVVPEPGALSLVGLALVGAAVATRRKVRQAA